MHACIFVCMFVYLFVCFGPHEQMFNFKVVKAACVQEVNTKKSPYYTYAKVSLQLHNHKVV